MKSDSPFCGEMAPEHASLSKDDIQRTFSLFIHLRLSHGDQSIVESIVRQREYEFIAEGTVPLRSLESTWTGSRECIELALLRYPHTLHAEAVRAVVSYTIIGDINDACTLD